MSRANFTQSDIDRISKAAARTGVPIVAEFIAPDDSKITITAGKGGTSGDPDGADLWLRDHHARATEGALIGSARDSLTAATGPTTGLGRADHLCAVSPVRPSSSPATMKP